MADCHYTGEKLSWSLVRASKKIYVLQSAYDQLFLLARCDAAFTSSLGMIGNDLLEVADCLECVAGRVASEIEERG